MEECTMKGYLSIRETSYKWNVSERRVNQYVTEGRIPGVERFGKSWAIPEDVKKPTDPRKDHSLTKSKERKMRRVAHETQSQIDGD